MPISDERRNELIRLASTSHLRNTESTQSRPTKFSPHEVPNPSDAYWGYFTREGAWELIVDYLKVGHPVEEVPLHKPPGKTGYEMLIQLRPNDPEIYVKLEIHRGYIWCRSFHVSD